MLVINILVTFALLFWPLVFGTSFMMFDAPGSTNNVQTILTVVAVLAYPVYIFLLYWLLGGSYFGLSGRLMSMISLGVVALACGGAYGSLIGNAVRGVNSSGVTITENAVYYDGKVVSGADPATFGPVPEDALGQGRTSQYHKDAYRVYYYGVPVPEAQADSFELAEVTERAGTSAETTGYFELRNQLYSDGSRLFFGGEAVPESGPGGVVALGLRHYIHNDRVYRDAELLEEADPETFQALSITLGKDSHNVFLYGETVHPVPDVSTFTVLSPYETRYAIDAHRVFHFNYKDVAVVPDADPESFTELDRGYAKDARHVYFGANFDPPVKIPGADPATFEVTGWDDTTRSDAKDAQRLYSGGVPRP